MPPEPHALPARATALLLALTASLLLFRLGVLPLIGPDEPRYARVAVEMHRSGEWVTPTLQGEAWLEKPVLYYWIASAAFSVLGEGEVGARLPSVAAFLLLVGATALVGARLHGRSAGLHSGFILATSVLPFAYGRAASMDMLLAALSTASIGLIALSFLGIAGKAALPTAAVFAGLATLAKGPLGFVLPGLVAVAYVAGTRQWSLLRRAASGRVIALFLLVAGPWYVLASLAHGRAFVDVFLLNHNLQRFTSTIHRHPGPPYYYVPLIVGGLFPWSGLLLSGLSALRLKASRQDLFVFLWFLLPFLFFSLAGSKLPGYVLPCLPPLALLMGRGADRLVSGKASGPFGTGPRAAAVLTLALSGLVAAAPAVLWRMGEPAWRLTLPLATWALLLAFSVSRRLGRDPDGALAVLRVGGAGFLLLLALVAPPILSHRESGRLLFAPAQGREVLVWGAWRTAWMAGYFYNEGRVRPIAGPPEIASAVDRGPILLLTGPSERRWVLANAAFVTQTLAEGPRGNALLRVEKR